jgi:putative nucleotidyltransferase with HDIG domain
MGSATITLEDIVRKTTDLPSIPAAALHVMRQTESNTTSASSVAQSLAQDQSLSVRVLRLSNSAYYGLTRQVSDLQEAVVVLGMRSVRNLAMVAATYPWMTRPLKGYCLGPRQLWTHSFGTALGAQHAARMSRKCNEDHAFTAGLLHDLGKVALSVWLENRMGAILNFAGREGITFDEAERKVLGYDHTEVGEYLATCWNLPPEITAAIRYHHTPSSCPSQPAVVDCVHVGNFLTMTMGFGLGGDGLRYAFDEDCLERLGLSAEDLDRVTDDFVEGYERYEALFEELAAA